MGTAGSKEELVKRPIAVDTCLPGVLRLYGLTELLLISLVRLARNYNIKNHLYLRNSHYQNKPVYI